MEDYYQKYFSDYYFIPSLNQFPSTGFGQLQKSTNTSFDVFGAFNLQSFKTDPLILGFDEPEKMLALAVHEFGHCFVDPAIDKIPEKIMKETENLYLPIKDSMSRQGYITWNICLHEHFVKAGEIIIAKELKQYDRAKNIMEQNVKNGYWYLPQITKQLEYYNRHKDKYRSYDKFAEYVVQHLKLVQTR